MWLCLLFSEMYTQATNLLIQTKLLHHVIRTCLKSYVTEAAAQMKTGEVGIDENLEIFKETAEAFLFVSWFF